MLRQHFQVGGSPDFWGAIGFGYRELTVKRSVTGGTNPGDYESTISGIDWLHLQLGADWRLSDNWLIGPMLQLDGGSYTSVTSSAPGSPEVDADVEDFGSTAMHFYALLAIRISYASQSLTVRTAEQ
jgi:hypothetical protein